MNLHNIIEASNTEFKQNLVNFCKSQDFRKLSPDLAEAFSKGLQSALSEAGKIAYKMFIESFEEPKDFICIGNKRLKFMDSGTRHHPLHLCLLCTNSSPARGL